MRCSTCKQDKSDNAFSWKHKGIKRSSKCKDCHKDYRKQHYQNNKQKYIDKASRLNQQYRKRNIGLLLEFLKAHPCEECGEDDLVVLEFHHLNPKAKKFGIAVAVSSSYTWDTIAKEITKCQVLCANCHRRVTAEAGGWFRSRL